MAKYWDGSDWALVVWAWETTNLDLNHVYQYTSISVNATGKISTTSTTGWVLYLLCQWDCTIAGNIEVNNKVNVWNRTDTFTWDWNSINAPWVANWWTWWSTTISNSEASASQSWWTQGSWFWWWWAWGMSWTSPSYARIWWAWWTWWTPWWTWWTAWYTNPTAAWWLSSWWAWSAIYDWIWWNWWNAYWNNWNDGTANTVYWAWWWAGWWTAWKSWVHVIIKAKTITISWTINTSWTNWWNGWIGWSWNHAALWWSFWVSWWGWWWGWWWWNAGNITLYYQNSLSDSATKTMNKWTKWTWWGWWTCHSEWTVTTTATSWSNWTDWSDWTFTAIQTWFTDPWNVYVDDANYATASSTDWIVKVKLSKDWWSNWQSELSKTFWAWETTETYWNWTTELWWSTWTWDDVDDTSFRLRVTVWTQTQDYKDFWIVIWAWNYLTWIEVKVKAKYSSSTVSINYITVNCYYWTSLLPIVAWSQAYASDWRKAWEWAWSGTWVLTFYDWTNWIACDTWATVAA